MPIRIEVLEDGSVEIYRSWIIDKMLPPLRVEGEAEAFRIIRYLLKREMRRVARDRFISYAETERRRLLEKTFKGT
jgi:hypothetical protein